MNLARQKSAAAFFDLDGTLLPGPSLERRFLRFLFERGEWSPVSLARWFGRFLGTAAFGEGGGAEGERFLRATHGNKLYWKNIRAASAEHFLSEAAAPEFFPAGLVRIAWHAAQAHRIFLVTGTLRPLAESMAKKLHSRLRQDAWPCFLGVCATRLGEREGRWTGEIDGEAVCGPEKARVIERLAEKHALDLNRSFAYGNSAADRWMLARVGNPVAVNPSPVLQHIVRAAGWPVLTWDNNPPLSCREAQAECNSMSHYTAGVLANWAGESRRKA